MGAWLFRTHTRYKGRQAGEMERRGGGGEKKSQKRRAKRFVAGGVGVEGGRGEGSSRVRGSRGFLHFDCLLALS